MKKLNVWYRLLRPLIHWIIILVIFSIVYKIRLFTDLIPGVQLQIPLINYRETMIYSWIAAGIFIGLWIIKNLYELHKPIQKYFQTFTKVWLYWIITITFIAYFGQWFIFYFGISRFIILVWSGFVFFVLFFFDQIRNYIESKFHQKSDRKIIIVWSDTLWSYKAIEHIKNGFAYKTEFIRVKDLPDIDLANYFMVVAVWSFEKELLQDVFEKTRFTYTRFYHISEGFFLEDVVYAPEAINNIIALEYKNSTLDWWSLIWKRLFDIFASVILIILFFPIMLVIWIAIKTNSKWPIFFLQKRVGKDNKLFTFIKFRSMFTHLSTGGKYGWAEAEKLYKQLIASDANIRGNILPKIKNDPRVTKVWRFLRKTSLDELPQLFCVLIGTMSLVGPRPHLPGEVEKYEIWQKRLLSIKPWITGYAQVFGRDNLDFQDEAKLDLYYIQNRSLFMDLYILFATFGVVFKGK